MKKLITIGLPSKGRLKEESISFFEKNNLKPTSNGGERNYFAQIENLPNAKIIYLHAKEIIQRLGDGTIDLGISGFAYNKNLLPNPSPLDAPSTNPAISTNSTIAGCIFSGFTILANSSILLSGTSTIPIFGSMVQKG